MNLFAQGASLLLFSKNDYFEFEIITFLYFDIFYSAFKKYIFFFCWINSLSQCDPNNPVKVTFNDVSAAAYRIKAGIEMTPCNRSHMSDLTDMEIYFKRDFLQYTGSFKERGGRYSLLKLSKVI